MTMIEDPTLSAEEHIERTCDWLIRELDDLCAFANNPETVYLVDAKKIAIGQIVTRAQIIQSFLAGLPVRKPGLKAVRNG